MKTEANIIRKHQQSSLNSSEKKPRWQITVKTTDKYRHRKYILISQQICVKGRQINKISKDHSILFDHICF